MVLLHALLLVSGPLFQPVPPIFPHSPPFSPIFPHSPPFFLFSHFSPGALPGALTPPTGRVILLPDKPLNGQAEPIARRRMSSGGTGCQNHGSVVQGQGGVGGASRPGVPSIRLLLLQISAPRPGTSGSSTPRLAAGRQFLFAGWHCRQGGWPAVYGGSEGGPSLLVP